MRRLLPTIRPRELGAALALAGAGALGALPLGAGPADPVGLCVWIAAIAPAAGALAAAAGLHGLVLAPVVPVGWAFALVALDATRASGLPTPAWAAVAWSGLFAAGFGVARAVAPRPAAGVRVAAWLLVLGALAAALPVGSGIVRFDTGAVAPAWRARALDLSPASLVVESAGVDWLLQPALYARARTSDIDPALRRAYRGRLAAPLVLVVGFALAAGGSALSRRNAARGTAGTRT